MEMILALSYILTKKHEISIRLFRSNPFVPTFAINKECDIGSRIPYSGP